MTPRNLLSWCFQMLETRILREPRYDRFERPNLAPRPPSFDELSIQLAVPPGFTRLYTGELPQAAPYNKSASD
jgi:hypothetical protein